MTKCHGGAKGMFLHSAKAMMLAVLSQLLYFLTLQMLTTGCCTIGMRHVEATTQFVDSYNTAAGHDQAAAHSPLPAAGASVAQASLVRTRSRG